MDSYTLASSQKYSREHAERLWIGLKFWDWTEYLFISVNI